jgi:AcrR family transcriptional regulator
VAAKDNSVNILSSTVDKPYHHGDLRAALLDAGLRLLQTRTADNLALREIAREVGVSATAVYRHFPDKAALLAALAQEGLDRLAIAQGHASALAGSTAAGFKASGLAYVRFAVDNPALFRLIFSCAQRIDLLEAPLDSVGNAMAKLREDIERLMPAHMPSSARKAAALHAWALVHGLAMLILDQQIGPDWGLVERVIASGLPTDSASSEPQGSHA